MQNETVSRSSYLSRAWRLLTTKERRRVIPLILVLLFGTALEVLTVSLFMPLVSLLAGGSSASTYPIVSGIIGAGGNNDAVVRMFGLLVLVFLFKSVFIAWSVWYQRGFAASVERRMSSDLFHRYIDRPYAFHLDNNSSVLMRNVGTASQFVTLTVDSLLVLSTDGAVLIATVILLAVVEPVGTFAVVSTTLLVAAFFHRVTRSRISAWSEVRLTQEARKIQFMQEGFGAIKEIKVLGREPEFQRRFDDAVGTLTRITRGYTTLTSLPRIWLELLTLLGMGVLVGVQLIRGMSVSATLPVLGVFAAGSFKVMPSVNRIIFAIQNLRYSSASMDVLDSDLPGTALAESSTEPETTSRTGVIEFRDVSFSYAAGAADAISGLSFQIQPGEAVGFVGSSGAGKSTLVDLLLGLLEPDSGKILVNGICQQGLHNSYGVTFGYVPQNLYLTDDTIRNNIALGVPGSDVDESRVQAALELASLGGLIADLPDGLDTMLGERGVRLSGGQRQRIGLARALYSDPDVLILDEATSALDINTEREIIEEIASMVGKRTLVIVAHRLTSVSICDTVHQVERGQLVLSGTAAEVIQAITSRQTSTEGHS